MTKKPSGALSAVGSPGAKRRKGNAAAREAVLPGLRAAPPPHLPAQPASTAPQLLPGRFLLRCFHDFPPLCPLPKQSCIYIKLGLQEFKQNAYQHNAWHIAVILYTAAAVIGVCPGASSKQGYHLRSAYHVPSSILGVLYSQDRGLPEPGTVLIHFFLPYGYRPGRQKLSICLTK